MYFYHLIVHYLLAYFAPESLAYFHRNIHICKPTRANAQTKGLQKSFRLSCPRNRLSGRF